MQWYTQSMEPLLLMLLALLAALVILFWREFHYRRQVRGLIRRLDRLEIELPDEGGPIPDSPAEAREEKTTGIIDSHVTADVLHGKTTFIRKLVAGENSGALKPEGEAILAIFRRINDPYSPTELSEDLNISLRTLERVLGNALQCTPRELIIAVKMREALRLMREDSLSVTSTAYRLGFSSPSHFSRRFKAFYKKAPSRMVSKEPTGSRAQK